MALKTISGKNIFPVGIGTWGMGGTWDKETGNEIQSIEAIRYSVSKGQNLIDSGEVYGSGYTDEIIGRAINGLVREDLYITDKIWETSVGAGKVRPAVENMLNKLGITYLDMLYIHKPWTDWPWRESIAQIDQLIDEGLVREFGVSNFNIAQLDEARKLAKHPIATNQLQYNLLYRSEVSQEMKDYCHKNGIEIIAYRPLAKGLIIENQELKVFADSKHATPAQVALAWVLAKGFKAIPMTLNKRYIDENMKAVEIVLSQLDQAALEKIAL